MPFEKGQSGNPAGRPRGSRNRAAILFENLLEGDSEAIARKAIELAKEGDIAAIRICLDRLAPARKIDPVVFELPPLAKAADTVAAAARIVAAVAAGELAPYRSCRPRKGDRHLRAGAGDNCLRGAPRQARGGQRNPTTPGGGTYMTQSLLNRLEKLEKMREGRRRTHMRWRCTGDTWADYEAWRDRLIAEGKASADDHFLYLSWK
jgi:hypothetical protein